MEKPRHTTLIGNQQLRQMLGMQTQSGLNKLRSKDTTFPKPIKTSDSRQPRHAMAWLKSKSGLDRRRRRAMIKAEASVLPAAPNLTR